MYNVRPELGQFVGCGACGLGSEDSPGWMEHKITFILQGKQNKKSTENLDVQLSLLLLGEFWFLVNLLGQINHLHY